MPGPLALVGGSPFQPDTAVEAELIETTGAREVLVLPTGSAYQRPESLVEAATSRYADLGVAVQALDVLGRPDALDEGLAARIGDAAMVYLAGVSPMHLVSVLKASPVWDALVGAWRAGAALLAADAGAMVLCDPMVDPRGGAFTVGLGLLPGVTVIPGFDTWSEDAVHRTRTLSPPGVAIVGVHAGSALVRDADGRWRGSGPVAPAVFLGGEPAPLDDLPDLPAA